MECAEQAPQSLRAGSPFQPAPPPASCPHQCAVGVLAVSLRVGGRRGSPALERFTVWLQGSMAARESGCTAPGTRTGEGASQGTCPSALGEHSTVFPDWSVQARVTPAVRVTGQARAFSKRQHSGEPSRSQKALVLTLGSVSRQGYAQRYGWDRKKTSVTSLAINQFPMSSFNTSRALSMNSASWESADSGQASSPGPCRSQVSTPPTFP